MVLILVIFTHGESKFSVFSVVAAVDQFAAKNTTHNVSV